MPKPFPPLNSPARVTQKDIAKAAGVSQASVTYALKDNPRLSEETRERIKTIAREMGYVPDPLFSILAHYRRRKQATNYHGTIAWLAWESDEIAPSRWRQSPHYLDYFEGASERAASHGYKLEEFCFKPSQTSPKRAGQILRSRGITGILLCPLFTPAETVANFPWQHFSCASFGYSLREPALHTVASAHYQNVRIAFRKLCEQGYRRIGLAIAEATDIRCNRFVSAAFLASQLRSLSASADLILPHFHEFSPDLKPENYLRYLQQLQAYVDKYQLDSIITADYQVDEMQMAPKKIKFVGLSLPKPARHLSGMIEDSRRIGAVAIDQLAAMIQRGEKGIPDSPRRTHVEGTWVECPVSKKSRVKS